MKKNELIKLLQETDGDEVVLRGNFGDTYMHIGDVQKLNNKNILLQSATEPIQASVPYELEQMIEEGVIQVLAINTNDAENFEGVNIGINNDNKKEIFLETERDDGWDGIITINAKEAGWLASKLLEYAQKTKEK